MMITTLVGTAPNPWSRFGSMMKIGAAVMMAFATGVWVESIYVNEAKLPQVHQEAAQAATTIPALKGQLKEKTAEVVEAHCERDLALNTTAYAIGAPPQPVHCPPIPPAPHPK